MKREMSDYFSQPMDPQPKVVSLGTAAKMSRQPHEIIRVPSNPQDTYVNKPLIGNSHAMAQVRKLIGQAALRDATVLIVGESGTGKELIARALHRASARAGKPFVDVNCAALTETLIESEIFGHERGSFTGAISQRRGKFQQADGGTLFLDEIGDMSMATQAKMLRVLQEQSFQRIGGEEQISVNVRIICATNHNLQAAVEENRFRMDLFYRINVMVIEVPTLRQRLSDVPELARHFLAAAFRSGNPKARGFSEAALKALQAHNWPGNVRELENAIERALTVCDDDEIQLTHLPPTVLGVSQSPQPIGNLGSANLGKAVERYERTMIFAALTKCDWNKSRAAVALNVTRRVLSYKMKHLGIEFRALEGHVPPAQPET
jgi:DNA-binding NtrC family response regulator